MSESTSPQELEPVQFDMPDAPEGEFGRKEKYAVKKWKPLHSRVIMLHVAGYTNKSVAAQVGIQPEHVSQLINDPRGQRAIRELEERMFQNFDKRIRRKMEALGDAAIDNIAQTVFADLSDASIGSKGKKHQDGVSFDLLDRLGYTKRSAESAANESGSQLPAEVGERLVEAIEKADLAKNADEIEMEESEEGEWRPRENGGGE